MPSIQVRDVPEGTMRVLRARADERGLTLEAYLRVELERLAERPTNSEVAERLAGRNRDVGPSVGQTVAEIRRIRESS
jgi:plasmid stability protein